MSLYREEVTPIPKGNPERREWNCRHKLGPQPGCSRAAPCPSCLGARNRRKGLAKQRAAKKGLGVPSNRYGPKDSNEENWRHYFRVECKAGSQIKPAWTAYLRMEKQANQNKAEGDPRPPIAVAMPDGVSDGIVIVRLSVWRQHVAWAFES